MSKLAFVGDIHGRLDEMYLRVDEIEDEHDYEIDAIVQVGDFQAFRTEDDLVLSAIPAQHQEMGDFQSYFRSGSIPKKTYFIGGNHENDVWHAEHPEGEEILPDLFYLGRSGFTELFGLTVAWISGNYSERSFLGQGKKSRYHHIASADVEYVKQSRQGVDVFVCHDWPHINGLMDLASSTDPAHKEFQERAQTKGYGCEPLLDVMCTLKPRFVFAGHMHMPLRMDLDLNGRATSFFALNFIGRGESIAVFDCETKTIIVVA